VAFNAIISLQLLALMSTYCISIGCVLYQRLANPRELPPSVWNLGKWSLPVNAIGFLYSFYTLIWIAWPAAPSPTRETFNWASVMFVAVLIISFGFYVTTGVKSYSGPVVLVRKI
jgi:amino acid transporter